MDHIKKEIRIFLVSAAEDFSFERRMIHEYVVPQMRQFCMSKYNIEFVIIDPNHTTKGLYLPNMDRFFFMNVLKECDTISDGPAFLILAGERLGGPTVPASISQDHFDEFMKQLKTSNNMSWMILQKAYNLDTSQLPPVYRLGQPALSQEENEALMTALMSVKEAAVKSGKLKQTDADDYFKADIEAYSNFIMNDKKTSNKALCCIRKIKNYEDLVKDPHNSSYLDINSLGLLDTGKKKQIEELTDRLTKSLMRDACYKFSVPSKTFQSMTDASFNSGKAKPANPIIEKDLAKDQLKFDLVSDDYLLAFASDLIARLKVHVNTAIQKKDYYGLPLFKEVETHSTMFEKISEPKPLRNREREVKILDTYLTSIAQIPGLLYGEPGCGKSALLKTMYKKIATLFPRTKPTILLRKCGRTGASSVLQLILASLTQQLGQAFKTPIESSCEYATCVYDFWRTLQLASPAQPIIILLDNVDSLFPSSHTEVFRWLPHKLPPYVKIIMTSSSESVYVGFKRRYEDSSAITVPGLDATTMITIFPKNVKARGKNIDEMSLEASNVLIQANSAPLYLQLLADILPTANPDKLPENLKTLFMKRVELLETKMGSTLVKYFLSYLATSRFGLTLSEIQDLISLENVVVKSTNFDFKGNTVFVLPAKYILLLVSDLKEYLSCVQIDDRLVIAIQHVTFQTAIIDYYQLTKEFGRSIHQAHADYWMARYGIGKPKPLFDKSVDSEERLSINIDRCNVNQQYFWCAEGRLGNILCSNRKLNELPFHLLKADRVPDLYKLVLFCFDFLYAKLMVSSVNDVIAEMYFLRQAYDVKNNAELELLISLLRNISKSLDLDSDLLGPELAGRLAHVVGTQTLFTMLYQQLDFVAPKVNYLLPTIPCYPTVDADSIRVELSKTATQNVLCAMSPDHRFVTTLLTSEGDILLLVWDTKSATKSQIINIGTHPGLKFTNMFYMPQRDEHIIVQYENDTDEGILFVNMDYALIEKKLSFPKITKPRIMHIARSYLTLRVDGNYQVFEHPSGKESTVFKGLSWPFIITPSDKYCIAPKAKAKSDISKKPETDLRLISMNSGDNIAHLTCPLATSFMITSQKNDVLFAGAKSHGLIYRYEIGNVAKRDAKRLKASAELSVTNQNILPNDLQDLIKRYLPMIGVVSIQLSTDDKYLLVEYNFNDIKNVYLVWQLASKTVHAVIFKKPKDIVRFSLDCVYVYQFVPSKDNQTTVTVYALTSGNIVQESDLRSKIQDFYILRTGAIFSVLSKEVVVTSLKQLESLSNKHELDLQSYSVALTLPSYVGDLNIIFSKDPESTAFQYYNMDTNALFTVDMNHENASLSLFPIDRRISPDGSKLMFAYQSEPNLEMKRDRRHTINEFVMTTDSVGNLIHEQTDFRKPEIPDINYFTGFLKSNPPFGPNRLTSDLVYKQQILRIFDLETGVLTSQLSIAGETILSFNNDFLFTIRPDHASITHNVTEATDIITLYDVASGLYVNSIYLEHPVITAGFVEQSTKMLVSCGHQGKWLKLLGGDYLNTIEQCMDIETLMRTKDDYARTVHIRRLHVFRASTLTALLSYFWKDSEKEMYYAKVDMTKRDVVSMFHAHDFIQDVSHDGSFAVDGALNVYDLNKGELLRRIEPPMFKDGEFLHCAPQFTNDSAYIVVLDNERNMLSVIRNDNMSQVVGKCQLHRMKNLEANMEPFRMTLGQGGRVIVVENSAEYKIFVIKEGQASKSNLSKATEPTYNKVMDRILYLMPNRQKNIVDEEFNQMDVPVHQHSNQSEESAVDDKSKKSKKGKKDAGGTSRENTNVSRKMNPIPA